MCVIKYKKTYELFVEFKIFLIVVVVVVVYPQIDSMGNKLDNSIACLWNVNSNNNNNKNSAYATWRYNKQW